MIEVETGYGTLPLNRAQVERRGQPVSFVAPAQVNTPPRVDTQQLRFRVGGNSRYGSSNVQIFLLISQRR